MWISKGLLGWSMQKRFSSKNKPNNGMVADPKSGAFLRVSPCAGELVFIVWPGAGRHMPSVRLIGFLPVISLNSNFAAMGHEKHVLTSEELF